MDVLERLPDAELGVMQALWAQKAYPASSGELMETLAGKHWRMPTLLKLLSRLEERGFVRRDKDGRSNRYTPLVRREDYLAAQSRSFIQKLCGGSLSTFASALCDSGLSKEELEELRELLRQEKIDNQGHNKTEENPYEVFVSDEAERFRAFADSILPVDITTARQIQIEEY